MKLSVNLIEDPFVLEASNEDGTTILFDAAEKIGGKRKGFRPMEALASSLASCMAIDVLLILRKQRQNLTHFSVEIEAQRADAVPSVFTDVLLTFVLNKEVDASKLATATQLTHEKYCSVSRSLHPDINIQIKHKFI